MRSPDQEITRFEAFIIGSGPAGSTAARLLALWGHRVALVTRPAAPSGPTLAESLPPSSEKLFRALGIEADIAAAGFLRSTGNTVWWGRDEARVENFGDGRLGWQVTGPALERVLVTAAAAAGAHLVHDSIQSLDAAREAWPATWVLDCTGRSGLVARARGWRRAEPGLSTVALVGVWHSDRWALPDDTHTVIESYSNGWAWSVPTDHQHRHIAVMVDPRTSDLARGETARAVYLAEIQKTRRFAALVSRAALQAGPWGWDASMYSSTHYADEESLLVGDAGSFIDPLSSAGVKKALASGWLAAIVVHTSLQNPAMRGAAIDFFEAREAEMHRQFREFTLRFLSQAAGSHGRAFWADRAEALDPLEERAAPPIDKTAVHAAFETLRAAPELAVKRGTVEIADRPAIRGREIVLEPRLVPAEAPAGLRYVHGVDLVTLIDLAPAHRDVGALFEAYGSLCPPVALHDFLLALSTTLARGWLVWYK